MRADLGTSRRSEAGNTLVEILITIVVVAIGVVGIMPALANSLALTDRYSKHSKADQVLTQVIEAVQRADYVCSGTTSYDSVLADLGVSTGYSIQVTKLEYWTSTSSTNAFAVAGCPPTPAPPAKIAPIFYTQRITVTVSSRDNRGRQTIEVVKRP